jgi:ribose transport system substrate-binding protein
VKFINAAGRERRIVGVSAMLVVVGAIAAIAAGVASAAADRNAAAKPVRIAYLSFAVANSYDAPMLAAAKKSAAAGGGKITVFDAANDPKKQFAQLQTAASSGQYDVIIVQPIFGTGLIGEVKKAIQKGVKVVNVDQILGPNLSTNKPQVAGLSGNVVQVPTDIGVKQGLLTVAACKAKKLNPCKIGYMYDIKASALDIAIRKGYESVVKKHPEIQQVAEGETFFTPAKGLATAQTMLQANPDIGLIVSSDQGIEGAVRVVGKNVGLVGYGGSAAAKAGIAAGRWFGSVWQLPATEGRLAGACAVRAVRTGKACATPNLPLAIVTKANVSNYKGEWPG